MCYHALSSSMSIEEAYLISFIVLEVVIISFFYHLLFFGVIFNPNSKIKTKEKKKQ